MMNGEIDIMDEYIDEASHSKLKYDFRLAWDYNNGHQIKVVYSLDNANIVDVGNFYWMGDLSGNPRLFDYRDAPQFKTKGEYIEWVRKNIRRKGNNDHKSTGQTVLAIVDLVTGERLQSATIVGPNLVLNNKNVIDPSAMVQDGKTIEDMHRAVRNNPDKNLVSTVRVGDVDDVPSYKATFWAKNVKDPETGADLRWTKIMRVEDFKDGRGKKMEKIRPEGFYPMNTPQEHRIGFKKFDNPTKDQALFMLYKKKHDFDGWTEHYKSPVYYDIGKAKLAEKYSRDLENDLVFIKNNIPKRESGEIKKYLDKWMNLRFDESYNLDYTFYGTADPWGPVEENASKDEKMARIVNRASFINYYLNDMSQMISEGYMPEGWTGLHMLEKWRQLRRQIDEISEDLDYLVNNEKDEYVTEKYDSYEFGDSGVPEESNLFFFESPMSRSAWNYQTPKWADPIYEKEFVEIAGENMPMYLDNMMEAFGNYQFFFTDYFKQLIDNCYPLEEKSILDDPVECDDFIAEGSHSSLKYDFRLGWDYNTGHQIKVVYSLDNIDITDVGDFYWNYNPKNKNPDGSLKQSKEEYMNWVKKNIRKKGNNDHQSKGQKVLRIVDTVTNQDLQSVALISPISLDNLEYKDTSLVHQQALNKDQLEFVQKSFKNHPEYVQTLHVGDIDNAPSFKATSWSKFVKSPEYPGEDLRFSKISKAEYDKSGRGWGVENIKPDYLYIYNGPQNFRYKENPTKKEALQELYARELDWGNYRKDLVKAYNNGKSFNGMSKKDMVGMYNKCCSVLKTIAADIDKIKAGDYNVNMMKKYRKAAVNEATMIQNVFLKERYGNNTDMILPIDSIPVTEDGEPFVYYLRPDLKKLEESSNGADNMDDEDFNNVMNMFIEAAGDEDPDAPPELDDEQESNDEEQLDEPPELDEDETEDIEDQETEEEPTEQEEPETEVEEPEEKPVEPPKQQAQPKPESLPKQADRAESSKNGIRRKNLYVEFIKWAKAYNNKNTFGSVFDKDAFKVSYPFVPEEMRYFYRLANPLLCVLGGDLTYFPLSDLKKLNSENKHLSDMMIFAATPNDLRVFYNKDKRVYRAEEENNEIVLKEVLGETFDLYLQNMIKRGDILNGPNVDTTRPVTESAKDQVLTKLDDYHGKLYFISEIDRDHMTLEPRIPDNFLVKNGYEDDKTPRVCFCGDVGKCLTALSQNVAGKTFNVYTPDDEGYDVYKPTIEAVPDSKITGELWITDPVKVVKIGSIRVTGDDGEDGIPYKYGDKTAYLYKWDYEWISRK